MACKKSEESLKLQDIISKSSLIQEGPPKRYQLLPKKQNIDGTSKGEFKLRRWTMGEKDPNKVNRTVLLVGDTGAGKTTMVNAMVNYVMGIEMEDNIWFEITEQGKIGVSQCQTTEMTVYDIFGFENKQVPYSLTIIDTSGQEDAKGSQGIIAQIHHFLSFQNVIDQIDAVGLVLKATENRLSKRQIFMFEKVISLFGGNMQSNIVALLTHSDGGPATNALEALKKADIKCAKDDENQPVHFLFNNCQTVTTSIRRHKKASMLAWETSMEGLEKFTDFLRQVKHQELLGVKMTAQSVQIPKSLWSKIFGDKSEDASFKAMILAAQPWMAVNRYKCERRSEKKTAKLKDIISKSQLINAGPPKRYQLVPQKQCLDGRSEEESKLRRWTIGEKDPKKANKIILLVGETGTGKSTLINTMVNYVMGVEWEDKVWFQFTKEGERSKTSQSTTSEVTVYEIFGFEECRVSYSLTIIDSPGFGDTKGIQEDKTVIRKLHDLFRCEDGIHEIDAVGLVLQAGTNRLSDRQKYIFDVIVSLFGKDMKDNIVALITHSDGARASDALQALNDAMIQCAKDTENNPVHFLFNNRKEIRHDQDISLMLAWNTTMQGMVNFTKFLSKAQPQKLKMTVDVLNKRVQLQACVNNFKERIKMIELKQRQSRQIKEAIEQYNADAKNAITEKEIDEPYKVKVPLHGWWDNKAVTCNVCEENCHYPGCTLAWRPRYCEVMVNEICMSCTNKCHYSKHVKEKYKYVFKTKKVIKEVVDLIKKREFEKKASGQKQVLAGLQKELDVFEKDKSELVEETYQCVVKLEEIALKGNTLCTYIHLDFLIDRMKEKRDTAKVQKLQEMKKKAEEEQNVGIDYIQGKGEYEPL